MSPLALAMKKALGVIRTKSPGMTGRVVDHEMGKTRSGKSIMNQPTHEAHASFSTHDHADAYRAHAQKLTTANPYHTHPNIIAHHKAAVDFHFRGMQGQKVVKSRFAYANLYEQYSLVKGERTIGKTRSGKHVHGGRHGADHPSYKGWSKDDHHDAMHAHHGEVQRILESLTRTVKRGGKGTKILQYLLGRHANAAHAHHSKSQKS